ncbi:hypothetical protein EDD17DRAFT_1569572 [Pisolithus thermaeus]|nr:hypothetical protein EDD17DRAFT_1569572 [Pisolithus thermaeus]
MNITLRDVYQTSMDGDRFWSVIHEEALYVLLPSLYAFQVFFVGTRACAYPQMKCFPVPDMLFDAVKEKQGSGSSRKRHMSILFYSFLFSVIGVAFLRRATIRPTLQRGARGWSRP